MYAIIKKNDKGAYKNARSCFKTVKRKRLARYL